MKWVGSLVSLGIVLAVGASMSGACTTHGDGGRCDFRNGNADCDNGLECVPAVDITLPEGGPSQTDICCPPSNVRAQIPIGSDICALNPSTPGSDASIPEGGFDSTVSDSPSDSPTDSPVDQASTDAADGASATDSGDATTE